MVLPWPKYVLSGGCDIRSDQSVRNRRLLGTLFRYCHHRFLFHQRFLFYHNLRLFNHRFLFHHCLSLLSLDRRRTLVRFVFGLGRSTESAVRRSDNRYGDYRRGDSHRSVTPRTVRNVLEGSEPVLVSRLPVCDPGRILTCIRLFAGGQKGNLCGR